MKLNNLINEIERFLSGVEDLVVMDGDLALESANMLNTLYGLDCDVSVLSVLIHSMYHDNIPKKEMARSIIRWAVPH